MPSQSTTSACDSPKFWSLPQYEYIIDNMYRADLRDHIRRYVGIIRISYTYS